VPGLAAICAALLLAIAAAGAAAPVDSDQFRVVTLRHAQTKFSIRAPEGFRLNLRNGVYVMRKRSMTVSYVRLDTRVSPAQLGAALLQALPGRVLVRAGDNQHFVAAVAGGSRNDHFVVERAGSRLAVTASTTRGVAPVALETLRQMGLSARGGAMLRAPKPRPQKTIPLRPYRAPDGGATALVPAGNDWDIQSNGGLIEGGSRRGIFLFGFSYNVPLTAPPNAPPSFITGPYVNAVQALGQLFPRLSPNIRNIRVRRVLKDAILPSFTSSGMLLFDYRLNGRPWTGVATVATDHPSKYSNFLWNFYYSGIGVPAGSDPAVGVGLLRSWRSWDPSGAIAARTRAAIALINETNEIWQQTNEFRSRIANQQSRDVGCLLSGYYIIEDNARRYGLPPLDCGQIYTERG
jgi:hypothetical protein